jgi:curved DNA-binding protein CbpA
VPVSHITLSLLCTPQPRYPMSQFSSSDWLTRFSDPYAVLGIAVTADDRRVLKRYRTVAKLLHPDCYLNRDDQQRRTATQIFAHLINPAYQKLKQEKSRTECLATLRLRVRHMNREEPLTPQGKRAQRLLKMSLAEVEVFYEQAVTELAEVQFQAIDQFEQCTHHLAELNLVYLRLKMGEPVIREKRSGIVPIQTVKPEVHTSLAVESEKQAINYAQRHYQRAQEYMRKENWAVAKRELQDAIRIENTKSEYHTLLAVTYLMQNLPTMAKVHLRQALKLNPKDAIALQYAKKLDIKVEPTPDSAPKNTSSGGLFGMFGRKR